MTYDMGERGGTHSQRHDRMRQAQVAGSGWVMPTVLRIGSYRFYFYSHEPNEPPHIHIDKANSSAKFWLERVALARTVGYSASELGELHRMVREHRSALLEAWHGYFGSGR